MPHDWKAGLPAEELEAVNKAEFQHGKAKVQDWCLSFFAERDALAAAGMPTTLPDYLRSKAIDEHGIPYGGAA